MPTKRDASGRFAGTKSLAPRQRDAHGHFIAFSSKSTSHAAPVSPPSPASNRPTYKGLSVARRSISPPQKAPQDTTSRDTFGRFLGKQPRKEPLAPPVRGERGRFTPQAPQVLTRRHREDIYKIMEAKAETRRITIQKLTRRAQEARAQGDTRLAKMLEGLATPSAQLRREHSVALFTEKSRERRLTKKYHYTKAEAQVRAAYWDTYKHLSMKLKPERRHEVFILFGRTAPSQRERLRKKEGWTADLDQQAKVKTLRIGVLVRNGFARYEAEDLARGTISGPAMQRLIEERRREFVAWCQQRRLSPDSVNLNIVKIKWNKEFTYAPTKQWLKYEAYILAKHHARPGNAEGSLDNYQPDLYEEAYPDM